MKMENKSALIILIFATVVIMIIGLGYPLFTNETMNMSNLSSWISAIISSTAFIWLIFGYFMQIKSLNLQSIEVERMAKFAALQQIQNAFGLLNEKVKNSGFKDIGSLSGDFPMTMALTIKNVVENNTDEKLKMEWMSKWTNFKSLCDEFIGTFAMMLKLYDEAPEKEMVQKKKPTPIEISMKTLNIDAKTIKDFESIVEYKNAWYIKTNFKRAQEIPVLAFYSKAAGMLAESMIRFEPGIDIVELEMLEDSEKTFPGCVKSEYLEKLRKKVGDREKERESKKKV